MAHLLLFIDFSGFKAKGAMAYGRKFTWEHCNIEEREEEDDMPLHLALWASKPLWQDLIGCGDDAIGSNDVSKAVIYPMVIIIESKVPLPLVG